MRDAADGPAVSVVGWVVTDAAVRELASLPYDEWKAEMAARKKQADAEANAAATAAVETAVGGSPARRGGGAGGHPAHFSRREPPKRKPVVAPADRLSATDRAECRFHPRTNFPKAMALMRQVLEIPDDRFE